MADSFQVQFKQSDLSSPKNWSNLQKWYLTITAGLLVLNAYVYPPYHDITTHSSTVLSQVQLLQV